MACGLSILDWLIVSSPTTDKNDRLGVKAFVMTLADSCRPIASLNSASLGPLADMLALF
jgi:hypothetical protein